MKASYIYLDGEKYLVIETLPFKKSGGMEIASEEFIWHLTCIFEKRNFWPCQNTYQPFSCIGWAL